MGMTIKEAIPILHDMYNYYNDTDIDAYIGFDKIDVLSEQISEIVEIRQRLGRINRYANKFKYWNESEDTNK